MPDVWKCKACGCGNWVEKDHCDRCGDAKPGDEVMDVVMAVAKSFVPGNAKTLRQIADEIRRPLQSLIEKEVSRQFEIRQPKTTRSDPAT